MSVGDGKYCITTYDIVCIMITQIVTEELYRTEFFFLDSLCGQPGKQFFANSMPVGGT